MNDKTKRQILK